MHKLLQSLIEELPKAALGALVPLISWLWNRWRGRDLAMREVALRGELVGLGEMQAVIAQLDDAVQAARLKEYVRYQRSRIVSELLAMAPAAAEASREREAGVAFGTGTRESAAARASSRRTWQRWLLLYSPHSLLGWLLHIVYFVGVAFVLLGCIVMLGNPGDPELGDMALGFGIIALVTLGIRAWALALEKPLGAAPALPARHSRARRWLLLYKPPSLLAAGVHLLFFAGVLTVAFGTLGVVLEWKEDSDHSAVLGMVFLLLVTVGLAAIANHMAARHEAEKPGA